MDHEAWKLALRTRLGRSRAQTHIAMATAIVTIAVAALEQEKEIRSDFSADM